MATRSAERSSASLKGTAEPCHDARASWPKDVTFARSPPPSAARYIHVPGVALDQQKFHL
jgi:hypothetical protein